MNHVYRMEVLVMKKDLFPFSSNINTMYDNVMNYDDNFVFFNKDTIVCTSSKNSKKSNERTDSEGRKRWCTLA